MYDLPVIFCITIGIRNIKIFVWSSKMGVWSSKMGCSPVRWGVVQ